MESSRGKQLAQAYKITGLPTVLILDPGGQEQKRMVGYKPAPAFLQFIR
ncbi:MAG: thioredoxin family protein [Acidobacteria bacterium]|nr:thioredoxin family protein [Acidobacteriota bacterium]